jgi:hypothetical protein
MPLNVHSEQRRLEALLITKVFEEPMSIYTYHIVLLNSFEKGAKVNNR